MSARAGSKGLSSLDGSNQDMTSRGSDRIPPVGLGEDVDPQPVANRPWDRLPWWGSALGGCFAILLLSLPRALTFDGGDLNFGWYQTASDRLLTGLTIDTSLYLKLVESFRGTAPAVDVAPFTDRALGPWLAHLLPFDAATSLYLVNLTLLCIGCLALARFVRDLTADRGRVALAVALWAISVPVVLYAAITVEAAAVGLLPVMLLALYRRRSVLAMLLLVPAVWCKETAIIFLVAAIARELLVLRSFRRLRAFAWIAVGALAYMTRETLVPISTTTFAPWAPGDLDVVYSWVTINLSNPKRPLTFLLTALPALWGLWLWLRRRNGQQLSSSDWIPLAIGAGAGLTLGLLTMPTAVLDGRTVWTSLPMGAALVAAWRPSSSPFPSSRKSRVRKSVLLGGMAVVLIIFLGIVANVMSPKPTVFMADLDARLARPVDAPSDWSTMRGEGNGTVDLSAFNDPDQPVIVSFSGTEPVLLSGPGLDWMDSGPGAQSGAVFLDAPVPDSIELASEGSWMVTVQPIQAGVKSPEGGFQAWTGTGPAVLVQATGVNVPYIMQLESSDPNARIQYAGRCALGECGEPETGEILVPIGTEVILIETTGSWSLEPTGFADEEAVLPGTLDP